MPAKTRQPQKKALSVLMWGTYDLGKPRTRLLRDAIRRSGADLAEIHVPVWEGREDKSTLSRRDAVLAALKWIAAYPRLIWRFLRAPRPDVIVVAYLGHLDVLILWPFARLRRTKIVWDAFLSLHDTVISDRKMARPGGVVSFLLKSWEGLACRAADRIVFDTEAQADLFRSSHALERRRATSVFVGAEHAAFPPATPKVKTGRASVLFYGQFIPLHGVPTIVEAARMARDRPIDWKIIGTGQQAEDVRRMLAADHPPALTWREWAPYDELARHISEADVCLGVFGASEKAGRVIPNKVFQILSAGRPVVTRDGPGIRELVPEGAEGVELVAPDDPAALLAAVQRLVDKAPFPTDLHAGLRQRFSLDALADDWDRILRDTLET